MFFAGLIAPLVVFFDFASGGAFMSFVLMSAFFGAGAGFGVEFRINFVDFFGDLCFVDDIFVVFYEHGLTFEVDVDFFDAVGFVEGFFDFVFAFGPF